MRSWLQLEEDIGDYKTLNSNKISLSLYFYFCKLFMKGLKIFLKLHCLFGLLDKR